MTKNWSTLEKGDKLYLMVPYIDNNINNIIKYEFQKSQVINVHSYEWGTNIRFKYTDKYCNKRRRIELRVNKYKYNLEYVSSNKETGWAKNNDNQYGDLIVTYINPEILYKAYLDLIDAKIKEQESIIKSKINFIEYLKLMKKDKINEDIR